MKLTATVLNANFNLIGFVVKGKAKEFGEMGNEVVERTLAINQLMKVHFNNSQAYFSDGKITEKGSFHINQLKIMKLSGDELKEIPNSITLTERYVHNNENVGFGVKFGDGTSNKYKYEDIMKLAEVFNPTNFVIRVNDKGKQFIAGKSGYPISGLPVVNLGNPGSNKKTKSGARPVTPVTGTKVNELDIFDIFDFVNSYKGFIINFAGTEYKATGDTYEKASDKFTSLGVGEVGNPVLTFNETKFNATCRFKNPGFINIPTETSGPVFAGTSTGIYTFIYRSKNIFYNAEHHMTKIGLIIPEEAVSELFDRFSSSMAIEEVTDANVINVVNRLINWKNSKIFQVDVSKLALISPYKYDAYIMNVDDIYKETLKFATAKISQIYVRGALKELAGMGYVAPPKNRPIAPQFSLKTEQELKDLIMAGVNIYDGSFTESGETVKNEKSGDSTLIPEIRYIIDGLDPKNYSYAKLVDTDKCPSNIASMITRVQSVTDFDERAKLLNSMMNEFDKVVGQTSRKIWMHKTAMWLKNGKRGVHANDADKWEINTKKRTKATCYDCNVASAKGLQILLTNVDIVK